MNIIAKIAEFRKKIHRYCKSLREVGIEINEINGNRLGWIYIDIVICTLKFGASPNNYLFFHFYELNNEQRGSFVTHQVSERLINKFNKEPFRDIFEDKTLFATNFENFIGREWIDFRGLDYDGFESFVCDKQQIIIKPIDSAQGQGIKKINIKNFKNHRSLFSYLRKMENNSLIIEDWILQHKEIAKLYNKSVNPIRIISILENDMCTVLVAGLTLGNGNDISNASCGDMVAPIDISTGIIKFPAEDMEGRIYDIHPISGKKITGFKIPYWEECIDLVDRASKVVPEVGYVGWDIAITPEGPLIIEGNTSPGYKFYQLKSHLPDQIGNRAIYERFLY